LRGAVRLQRVDAAFVPMTQALMQLALPVTTASGPEVDTSAICGMASMARSLPYQPFDEPLRQDARRGAVGNAQPSPMTRMTSLAVTGACRTPPRSRAPSVLPPSPRPRTSPAGTAPCRESSMPNSRRHPRARSPTQPCPRPRRIGAVDGDVNVGGRRHTGELSLEIETGAPRISARFGWDIVCARAALPFLQENDRSQEDEGTVPVFMPCSLGSGRVPSARPVAASERCRPMHSVFASSRSNQRAAGTARGPIRPEGRALDGKRARSQRQRPASQMSSSRAPVTCLRSMDGA